MKNQERKFVAYNWLISNIFDMCIKVEKQKIKRKNTIF